MAAGKEAEKVAKYDSTRPLKKAPFYALVQRVTRKSKSKFRFFWKVRQPAVW